jgi:hypothetical protein
VPKPTLPTLPADPDARLIRWGWIGWMALTLFLVVRFVAMGGSAISFIVTVQIAALWILWPLYRGGRALWHWMRAAPYARWNGSYYEFDGRQIRVLFDEDTVFVVAADVFDALGLSGRATDPQRGRAVAGREGLLRLPGRREIVFTERGLAAWLERRTEKKAAAFKRWFDLQVLAPHRKRRARVA